MHTINEIPIRKTAQSRLNEVVWNNFEFGTYVADHMLVCDYRDGAWQNPEIIPYDDLRLAPATLGLHYGQSVFEGMKAFHRNDGRVSIFRIDKHHERLNRSLDRMCMPAIPFDLFDEGLRSLVSLDAAWVPNIPDWSLYLRPFVFATDTKFGVKISDTYKYIVFTGPVAPLYAKSLKVRVEDHFIRAAPGGTGYAKCAGNYGGAMYPTKLARQAGFDQVLWTDLSSDLNIEESGTMNVGFVIDGKVVTPPVSDTILEGVTRDCGLKLAADLGYPVETRQISAYELVKAHARGALQEAFGIGTAAVTVPIELIQVGPDALQLPPVTDNSFTLKVRKRLLDIRTGALEDTYGWNTIVNPS
jgi:branched-chain amino acid aminotransferase